MNEVYSRPFDDTLKQQLDQCSGESISQFVELFPEQFGLEKLQTLIPLPREDASVVSAGITKLYQDVLDLHLCSQLEFDHTWSWILIWRQRLSLNFLAGRYGGIEPIAAALHPRAQKAVRQIYSESLDAFMQWFPWSWFSDLKLIGAGGFSAVYATTMTPVYDPQPLPMALKIVDEKILNEISVQSKAVLPLLFQGLTVCESTGDLMMVMKLSNDGNLEDHMQELPLGDLDLKTITGTILRLATNLKELHRAGICHRNVHPRNIVCTDSDYFLVDYRFATPSHESSSVTALTKAVYGRLPYVAPEVRQGVYTEKSDIYSLGIIIWQLVSKVIFPSPDVLLYGQRQEESAYRIEPVRGVPDWYERLYVACLEPKSENRPNATDICQVLQSIHDALEYSVPLDRQVTEYIVARRAEVADHLRMYHKIKGNVSTSTTRLYTLSNLPNTSHFIHLPFTHMPFASHWPVVPLIA